MKKLLHHDEEDFNYTCTFLEEKFHYSTDVLQNSLNLAIESGKKFTNGIKDPEMLDIILRHIKIEFTVSTSKLRI